MKRNHGKKFSHLILSALFLFVFDRAFAGLKLSGSSLMVSRNTQFGGITGSSSLNFRLNSVVGEIGTLFSSGSQYKLRQGYIKVAHQPGSVVSITAATKSTGTLQLTWNSPGADGVAGNIINGYYRLDYSSDSAHVFSPNTYKLEFSTSTEANRQQSLILDNLLANTTYYAKIYISDAEKYFSEDSGKGEESTLANIPVNPYFSDVSPCSVTISWDVPGGGTEGYEMNSSSTNFGLLYPGGEVKTGSTQDGITTSLTLTGLMEGTTYFFNVASYNHQGDKNFITVISTVTRYGICDAQTIANLQISGDAWSRRVVLNWQNPSSPDPEGILIFLSTNSASPSIEDGTPFEPGDTVDNSVVKSTSLLSDFTDSGLQIDTTYFYHLFTQYEGLAYSVSVSTHVFLDLPPMTPSRLAGDFNADKSSFTITWKSVISNRDGSLFFSTSAPKEVELAYYRIERATSVLNANWVTIATVPATAQSFTEVLPSAEQVFLYKISAIDSMGSAEGCMAIDTEKNLYAFAPDNIARFKVPASLSKDLWGDFNTQKQDIVICAAEEAAKPEKKIFTAARFDALESTGKKSFKRFKFSASGIEVILKYQVSSGKVVPSGMPHASSNIQASAAARNLAMYWDNTSKYVKLYGKVDPLTHTVSVQSAMTGKYQIRLLYRENGATFDISGLSNKIITPNGDGLNDSAVFTFDNPKDSAFSGKIYDIEGGFVADMFNGPVENSLEWDGKRNGKRVHGGVYVYQIRAENKVFNGTLLVIR